MIGIISVGAALGRLVLARQSRTGKRLDALATEVRGDFRALRSELRALGERVARLEGLIEGFGVFRPAGPAATAGDHGREAHGRKLTETTREV